jgi:hypothetical protein
MTAPFLTLVGKPSAAVISLDQTRKEFTAFEPCRDGVLMHVGGRTSLLTPQQIEDQLSLYQREERAAEAEASLCRRRFNQIWDARCAYRDRLADAEAPTPEVA